MSRVACLLRVAKILLGETISPGFLLPRMFGLALKMLFGDTAKYLMLVAGLIFATFLIVQQASVFCGLMLWTTATLKNVSAPIYVVEERVEQINETNPLRDTDVALVRSVSAVKWAMPLYSGIQRARLENGSFKTIQLVGIDAASLAGAPQRMKEGDLESCACPTPSSSTNSPSNAFPRTRTIPRSGSRSATPSRSTTSRRGLSASVRRCVPSPAAPTSGRPTSGPCNTVRRSARCSPPSSPPRSRA